MLLSLRRRLRYLSIPPDRTACRTAQMRYVPALP